MAKKKDQIKTLEEIRAEEQAAVQAAKEKARKLKQQILSAAKDIIKDAHSSWFKGLDIPKPTQEDKIRAAFRDLEA